MTKDQKRLKLIKLIHVGRRELKMADDVYRQILTSLTQRESTADLSIPQLEAVLKHLQKAGFKIRVNAAKAKPSLPLDQEETSRKIRAIWLFLHELGAVKDSSEYALFAYVRRITGVDALQWINAAHAQQVIETLKKWAVRVLPQALQSKVDQVDWQALTLQQRAALTAHVELAARGTYDPMRAAYDALKQHLEAQS